MTWPQAIATAIGVIALALIVASQHGIGHRNIPDQPDGEHQP